MYNMIYFVNNFIMIRFWSLNLEIKKTKNKKPKRYESKGPEGESDTNSSLGQKITRSRKFNFFIFDEMFMDFLKISGW